MDVDDAQLIAILRYKYTTNRSALSLLARREHIARCQGHPSARTTCPLKSAPLVGALFEFDGNASYQRIAIGSTADWIAFSVPEPSSWGLMLIDFAGLGFAFGQSRRKTAMA
jgi:hypothetical protein